MHQPLYQPASHVTLSPVLFQAPATPDDRSLLHNIAVLSVDPSTYTCNRKFRLWGGGVAVSNAEYTLATKSNSTLSLVCTRHNAAAAAADDDDNDDDDAVC